MTAQETKVVNAVKTTLASTMAAGATSFQITSATGFPAVPFYVCIDPLDPAKREYMLVDDEISGTTCTLSNVSMRNLAGSAGAVEHASGAEVRVSPAMAQLFDDIHDRIDAVSTVANAALPKAGGTMTGDLVLAGAPSVDLEAATKKYVDDKRHDTAWSKTVAVQGEVKVPSGAVDYLVPFTVHVESGEVLTVTKVYDAIRSGTSVTYKITVDGVDEVTGLSATTTHNSTDVTDFTVTDGERLAVVVTAVSGTPDGLEVTLCGTMSSID